MSYGAFARWYDALTADVDYDKYAEFIHTALQKYKPGCKLIADLACGTGSLTVRLAELGYDVIGVDSSPDMLSVAREKGDSILYLNQRLEELDLYGTVDAFVCTLDSINHIVSEKNLVAAFTRAALFLEPDGIFIFDANTPYKHREILADNAFIYDLGEIYCVWQNETNNDLTSISLDFFEKQGEVYIRSSESMKERGYSPEHLSLLLEKAGLEIIGANDDYSAAPPNEKSQRIVYICKKIRQI